MPKLPHHLAAKPKNDDRQHPIVGMLYRVRDRGWAVLWGENLSWNDAKKLTAEVSGSLKSRTARVEAMDIAIPPELEKAAAAARHEAEEAGRVLPAPKQAAPRANPEGTLAAMQAPALVAAAGAAAEATKRHGEVKTAAERREQYKREREAAEAETKRLAEEAERLDAELDESNVPESDIDDVLGGVAAMPSDEEISKAKAKAAEEERKRRQLS